MPDKKQFRRALKIIKEWRKTMMVDPIWDISIGEVSSEEMGDALGRLDISAAEYFRVVMGINERLLISVCFLICQEKYHRRAHPKNSWVKDKDSGGRNLGRSRGSFPARGPLGPGEVGPPRKGCPL